MKKFAIPFLAAFIAVALLTVPALAQPEAAVIPLPAGTASPRDWTKHAPDGALLPTAIKAESAILMDDKTGKVLFEKEADKKQYPASITKIMTCLLALESVEKGRKLSELVTIGDLPNLEAGYVKMDPGLKKGETLTLKDLLYGLMLDSANDAANAIAMHISEGHTVASFAEMMNAKAAELGMTGTHFTNPYGQHDVEHYTTARDMAILARAARKYPTFVNIVSTLKYTMPATNKTKKTRVFMGHNKLVNNDKTYGYVYATGIKTGYTDAAKRTLVSSAKKDSMYLIGVTMRSSGETDWVDSVTMFEYGFNFYDTLDLRQLLGEQTIKLQVLNSAGSDPGKGELELLFLPRTPTADTAEPYITDRKEVIEQLKSDLTQFEMKKEITKDTAPIAKDEVVGKVTFLYEGKPMLEYDLMASRDIKEMPTAAPTVSLAASSGSGDQATAGSPAPGSTAVSGTKNSGGGAAAVFIWVGSILLLLLIAMLAIRFVNMQRRNQKYRQYNYRQGNNNSRNR